MLVIQAIYMRTAVQVQLAAAPLPATRIAMLGKFNTGAPHRHCKVWLVGASLVG